MKHLKFSFASMLLVLLALNDLFSQSTVPDLCTAMPPRCPIGNCDPDSINPIPPSIYPGECSIGIERYLSHAVEMNFLTDFIFKSGCSENCSCEMPYSCDCGLAPYCPEKYCEMINSLVAMKAQFIGHISNAGSYHEHEYFPKDPYYCNLKQAIKDINSAYDCAGLPRPIIQSSVGEIIASNNFDNAKNTWSDSLQAFTDGINRHIPTQIIEKFFEVFPSELDSIDPDAAPLTFREYYYFYDSDSSKWLPKSNLFFEEDRVSEYDSFFERQAYVIEKLEMRLWFFYRSIVQIDMGYNAIHFGIYYDIARNDAPEYNLLYGLTQAIRDYATEQGTFVLISGETPYDAPSPKWNGTEQLIFDFDQRAMRPREIAPDNENNVDGDGIGCDDPIAEEYLALFNDPNSSCFGTLLPAIIDPCTINSAGGTTGGISPLGCEYEQVPYVVHFDGFSVPDSAGVASPYTDLGENVLTSTLTWGYNDHRWFSTLSPECRRAWFNFFYCDRRNYHGGHGFVLTPGIISVGYATPSDTINQSDKLLLCDDSLFMNEMASLFSSDTSAPPQISIIQECIPSVDSCEYSCICNDSISPTGNFWRKGTSQYRISIINRNCSSTYSIHIKDPNGQWLPQVLGHERILIPEMDGNYQIGVREDNLTLPNGAQETWDSYPISIDCCIKDTLLNIDFHIEEMCYINDCSTSCQGITATANKKWRTGDIIYKIVVDTPKCDFVYSIKVIAPSGALLTSGPGITRSFAPTESGVYAIEISEQLINSPGCKRQITQTQYLWDHCCGGLIPSSQECPKIPYQLSSRCTNELNDKLVVDFEIRSLDSRYTLLGASSGTSDIAVNYTTLVTPTKLVGSADIFDKSNPMLRLISNFDSSSQIKTVLTSTVVSPCNVTLRPEFRYVENISAKALPEFTLSPNPMTNKLSVLFSEPLNEPISLQILNSLGIEIQHFEFLEKGPSESITIDTHQLNSGLYYLKIKGKHSNNSSVKKVIKI